MKSDVFFVTGYPRSRTAWCANLLTWGDVICEHEPVVGGAANFLERLLARREGAKREGAVSWGASDPALLLNVKEVREVFPNAHWLVIERPWVRAEESLRRLGVKDASLEELERRCDEGSELLGGSALVTRLKFEGLKVWQVNEWAMKCVHGWDFCPPWRARMLDRMNVQVHAAGVTKEMLAAAGILPPGGKGDGVRIMDGPAEVWSEERLRLNKEYFALVREACCGDEHAMVWVEELCSAAWVWDHLVDGDVLTRGAVDRVFQALTTRWPMNRFVREWGQHLGLVVMNAVSAGRAAEGPGPGRLKCHDIYTEPVCAVAFLKGGQALVDRVMPRLRALSVEMLKRDDEQDGEGKK